MGKLYFENIVDTIGSTPLIRVNKLNQGVGDVFLKVEFFNPGGSVKDRVALAMVEDAEKKGRLAPGATIIEPTSGNTGIGLALVAAVKGYKLVLTTPETMSVERRKLAKAYGADVVLTPGEKGMKGAIERAEELHAQIANSWIPMQFDNDANPRRHYEQTGQEILEALDGKLDAFVAGVGTGGTLAGVGKLVKEKRPNAYVVAVEPTDSAVLSGMPAGPHKLQGIGAGFVPKTYDPSVVDAIVQVSADDAGKAARACATQEGILVGISSGAALHVALELSKRADFAGKNIVALLPDTGERYLSTWLFDDEEPSTPRETDK